MSVSMSPDQVTARLKRASALSDLDASKRLDAKLGMSPEGVTKRLREASDLLRLCQRLGALSSSR
jgi:hypothetical protein